uniref:Uncharacterized protein n=1 Tax=Romanomermis culicivorax TaxID=13658 RepID=A0A915L453_ROMCU
MTNAYFWEQLPPAELQACKEWANYKSSFTSKSSSFFGSIIGAIIRVINVLKETRSKIWTTTQNVDEYKVMGKTWQEKFIVVANCLWLWIVKIWELMGGKLLDWFCGPDVPRSAMLSTLMGDV